MKANPCPKCGCDDLHIDSNLQANASWIECNECEHRLQMPCSEEEIVDRWNVIPAAMSATPPATESQD